MIIESFMDHQVASPFSPLLTEGIAKQIEQGKLLAVGAYDTWDDIPVALMAFREQKGWMELVWLRVAEDYLDSEDAYAFVEHRLEQAKNAGLLQGAFIDFMNETEEEPHEQLLRFFGFHRDMVSSGVYEIRLSDLEGVEELQKQPSKNVRQLSKASDELRRKMAKTLSANPHPIPIEHPIDWSLYDDSISVIYMDETMPKGMLLFERTEDALIFSCAWATDPRQLMGMLTGAFFRAKQTLAPDMQIWIPVVNRRMEQLVKHLLPTAKCGNIIEWSLPFHT